MATLGAGRLPTLAAVMAAGVAAVDSVPAQDVSLNYESLSSLEEPLATEFGDVTVVLSGLLDTSLTYDSHVNDTDAGLLGNLQLSALTQTSNRWRVGMTYFGQFAVDETPGTDSEERYSDNAALSAGGVWGTALGGNVSGVVREQTRRLRGAGNASLAFDDSFGDVADRGGGYVGRFGPWIVATVLDGDGHFELGAMFQRPAGDKDYRLTVRTSEGDYTAADESRRYDTRAGAVVGEIVYGSTSLDVGMGLERLSSSGREIDRWYVSSGVRTKAGVASLSVEGHYGRVAGVGEVSTALGVQYDLARGLSVNLGLNHAKAKVAFDGVDLVDTVERQVVLSLRYSF